MSGRPDAPVQLLLLWHQHQPGYGSPAAGRPVLPWVRLHATKDYLDMADRLLARPALAVTTNLVPSLLEQLAACEAGVGDPELDLAGSAPADLDDDARRLLLARLGIVPLWARNRFPALARFAERRAANDPVPLSDAEVIDLQALHTLAWIDPLYYGRPGVVDPVARAGRGEPSGMPEKDQLLLEAKQIAHEVLPRFRTLAAHPRGEVSVSPFYHPILPLLVDVSSARRALPQIALPHEPFAHPEDARAHLVAARRTAERALGVAAQGLWPSEGSVSPEVVELAREAGFVWLASDEEVLRRSLEASGRPTDDPWAHARPWQVGEGSGDGGPWLFFRDRELSDRIGFAYSRWPAGDAVQDFMARLEQLRDAWKGPGPARLLVALDGENCWENYPDDGDEFLERLYDALEGTEWLGTTTPRAVVAELESASASGAKAGDRFATLHSGSWIGGTFRIWIGHPEKNRAWEAVSHARRALVAGFPETAGAPPAEAFWDGAEPVWGEDLRGVPPEEGPDALPREEARRQAWRHLMIAEGSDWCWWLGDDHYTADKAMFDHVLREHLIRVYELAGQVVPAELLTPIGASPVNEERTAPRAVLLPSINGRLTSYYEWNGAGRWRPAGAGGAMHANRHVREIDYGYDERNLYVRVQLAAASPRTIVGVEFLEPEGYRVLVERNGNAVRVEAPEAASPDGKQNVRAAWETVVEMAVPFAFLARSRGQAVRWVVTVREGPHVTESAPDGDPLGVEVPGPDLEARFWSA